MKRIFFSIVFILLFVINNPVNAAGTKKIGEICTGDSQCKSNDCESSSKKDNSGNTLKFCDCDEVSLTAVGIDNSSEDCKQEYSAPTDGSKYWICKNGPSETFGLDYCLSENGKTSKFPLPELQNDNSLLGKLKTSVLDTKVAQTQLLNEIKTFKPSNMIKIPNLTFTDVENTIDSEGYIHLPWIGELLKAVYNWGMVVASIVAAIMIILTATKIIMGGGGATAEGYKKIGTIVVGLFIAWGSYAILYNINPALVEFKALRIKYIDPIPLEDFGESTMTASEESQNETAGGSAVVGANEKFSDCPIQLSNAPVITDIKRSLAGFVPNSPRRKEFIDKITKQNIINGASMQERVMQAADAVIKCQIVFANCGTGTASVFVLAGNRTDNSCLFNKPEMCKMGQMGEKGQNMSSIHNALDPIKYDGKTIRAYLKGLWCGSKDCAPRPDCIADKQAVINKIKGILEQSGKWGVAWKNDLQPGDYYSVLNVNTSCDGLHSAMFLGWKTNDKDGSGKIGWVAQGDKDHLFRRGTKDFTNINDSIVLSIKRPINPK